MRNKSLEKYIYEIGTRGCSIKIHTDFAPFRDSYMLIYVAIIHNKNKKQIGFIQETNINNFVNAIGRYVKGLK